MSNTNTRRCAVIGTLLLLVAAAAGCSMNQETTMRTADETRETMQQLVRDTMEVVGGEWSPNAGPDGEPVPNKCTLLDGSSGVTFSWDQFREGSSRPQQIVKRVAAMWEARGYAPQFDGGPMHPDGTLFIVRVIGGDVDSISVNASTSKVTIHVDSLCGTGDIDAYEQKYLDEPLEPPTTGPLVG